MTIPFRKTYEVIGYAYEADLHCVACTIKRFGVRMEFLDKVEDDEGNPIHPVFLGDEREGPEYCGDCREELD